MAPTRKSAKRRTGKKRAGAKRAKATRRPARKSGSRRGKTAQRTGRKSTSRKSTSKKSTALKRRAAQGIQAARGGLDTVRQAGERTWEVLKSTTAQVVEGVRDRMGEDSSPASPERFPR